MKARNFEVDAATERLRTRASPRTGSTFGGNRLGGTPSIVVDHRDLKRRRLLLLDERSQQSLKLLRPPVRGDAYADFASDHINDFTSSGARSEKLHCTPKRQMHL